MQKLFSNNHIVVISFILACLCASVQSNVLFAQKRNPKIERTTVKDAPEETKHNKKNVRPKKRKKLQSRDFINHKYSMRKKMTAKEKRQVDKIAGVDRKKVRKEKKKEKKTDRYFKKEERKLRRKHMRLQDPDVRKRMRKNFRKTKKEFISLQQKKRKNPLNKKPGKPKKRKRHTLPKP